MHFLSQRDSEDMRCPNLDGLSLKELLGDNTLGSCCFATQDPECRASFEEKGLGGHKQTNADLGDLHKRNISIQKKNGQITVNSLLFSSTQQKCE